MEDIKKVVAALLQEFAKEEAGNRVTSNNVFGLSSKLMAALDGQITLKPADDEPSIKE